MNTLNPTPGAPGPESDPAALPPILADGRVNILIVDDEPKNLTVLEVILDDPGYRLVRANHANEALLALVAEEFALLILDIRMPDMSGFELAQMIKQRKKTASVPIIFLTAYLQRRPARAGRLRHRRRGLPAQAGERRRCCARRWRCSPSSTARAASWPWPTGR